MLKVIRLTPAVLLMVAIIAWPSPVMAEDDGSITGQLVNKTANGSPVSTVDVSLTVYLNGKATADKQRVASDASGKFEFKGLSTDNGTSYTVSANFQEAEYISRKIILTPSSASQAVELDLYDSTTSDENIQISNGHMVVYVEHGDLEVMEIWRFSNLSDKTFTGAQGRTAEGTLRFALPSGATSVSSGPESAVVADGTGAVSTLAVLPGISDVVFSYFLPYQGPNMAISRKTDYPIANFSLLVQDAGVKVTSSALTRGNPQMMNGTNFLYFTANNLTRGIELDASLSGIVKPSAGSSEKFILWPWLLTGVAVLGLVVTVAYSRFGKRQIIDTRAASVDEVELLGELARLDDDYEAGGIGEKEYRAQRARVKASLLEVYDRSRGP
ncbi:MAG: hypothetical protein HY529_04560 [Chloroflexi bacterium]|nr:hypothetical protein [Chloroflexota bacterium]